MPVPTNKCLDLFDLVHAYDFAVGQRADFGVDVGLLDARHFAGALGEGDVGIVAALIDDRVEFPQPLFGR